MQPTQQIPARIGTHFFSWAVCLCIAIVLGCAGPQPAPPQKPGKPKPYRVGKTWYHPVPDARGFKQEGIASWYGKKFHGRKTSSGETYNMYAMTAAHKTLPLGTYVHVKSLENGNDVTVRINDRGPFVQGRIIDLSYSAAKKMDMIATGTARVSIVPVEPDTREKKVEQSTRTEFVDYHTGNFTFQIGAFSSKKNAYRLRDKLNRIYKNAHVAAYDNGREMLYRVRVGRATSLEQAVEYEKILIEHGYKDVFIVAE